jgi:hypothetical protein
VWSDALTKIEGAWRTHAPTNDANRHKLSTTPDCTVCPSDSKFQPIIEDLGRFREVPGFALSRRQRGFESRWGHKIKLPLTRPDNTVSRSGSPRIHRQGRRSSRQCCVRQSSRSADFARPKMGLRVPADLCCRELGPRPGRQGALAHCKGLPTCRRPPSTCDPPSGCGTSTQPRDGWRLPDHSPLSPELEERNDQRA